MSLFSWHRMFIQCRWQWVLAGIFCLLLLCRTERGFTFSPPPGSTITNTASAIYSDGINLPPNSVNNKAAFSLSGAPNLRIEKTADSEPVAAGAAFTYNIWYENSGNADATNVSVVDPLPLDVTFQSASKGGIYSPSSHTVTFDLGMIPPGNSGVLTITVQARNGLATGKKIINTASIASSGGVAIKSTVATTVDTGSNLIIESSTTSLTAPPNGLITYKLNYRNIGNLDARSVRIADMIPAGTTYVTDSATAGGTITNETVNWYPGTVPPGGRGEVSFQVRVSPLAISGQQINNSAIIFSTDQIRFSNSLATSVTTAALLSVKMGTPDPVRAGNNITYTLQVENPGTSQLTGIVLKNRIPAGTTFISADNGAVVSTDLRELSWNIGTLAIGQIKNFTLTVQVNSSAADGQQIENIATATSNETDQQTARAVTIVTARTIGIIGFFNASWQPAYGYMSGDNIYLQVMDSDRNMDPAMVETISVELKDLKTGDSETVILAETGPNSGIFRSSGVATTLNSSPEGDGRLAVSANSRLQATYIDPLDNSPVHNVFALVDPLGVVFDSASGLPITGTTVTLRPWNNVANSCDLTKLPELPAGQVNPALPTGTDGRFAFPLVFAGDYCYQVENAPGHVFPSIVATADLPAGFTIGNGSRGEKFTLSVGDPPLIRDIPVDQPPGAIKITKTANKAMASIGDMIVYTIRVESTGKVPVKNIIISDTMPIGIQYLPGSSRLAGHTSVDPKASGRRVIVWEVDSLEAGKSIDLSYRAVAGPDSTSGDGVNSAMAAARSLNQPIASNVAKVRIKITAGLFTQNGTILGKVFFDRNGNHVQDQGDTPADPAKLKEPGIPNVVLFMEDGSRVITDANGKFSILGVLPGTHVLRVDEASLPKNMRLVPLSNRFLGDGASQFIDLKRSGLFQADFATEKIDPNLPDEVAAPVVKPASGGNPASVNTQPSSAMGAATADADKKALLAKIAAQNDEDEEMQPVSPLAAATADAAKQAATPAQATAPTAAAQDAAPSPVPPPVQEPVPLFKATPVPAMAQADAKTESQGSADPGVKFVAHANEEPPQVTPTITKSAVPETDQALSQNTNTSKPPISPGLQATNKTDSNSETSPPKEQLKPGEHDWEEEIKTMTPDLDFLSPTDGSYMKRSSIRVMLKTRSGSAPALYVNGVEVDNRQIGKRIDFERNDVTLFEYIDVQLKAGEVNIIKAEFKDMFGIKRGEKEIKVTAAGSFEKVTIKADRSEVPADGTSLVSVDVMFLDRHNMGVPYPVFATVSASIGEIVENDADPTHDGIQITMKDGIGHFTLKAPRESGEAVITVGADNLQETVRLFCTPNLRSLFLVGTGELTFGHDRGRSDAKLLNYNTWYNNNYYAGARGAAFLKGKVFDNMLLTAAFDSDKKKQEELFKASGVSLDLDDKYPIYGDESKSGSEAMSADKLYVKLEKNRSYILYGDLRTDLTDTKLAAYTRQFLGVKYELNSGDIKLRSFGSYTDQSQVIDSLPGKGISGYYYLTDKNIINGSERVVVEVRDRYRPDYVISRQSKGRGSDYEIDYDLGTLLFKEPIPTLSSDYNPVYIVVSYESRSNGKKYYVYGGRGAYRPNKWLEVGATAVVEEKSLGNATLKGADMTLFLPYRTILKSEYVETTSVFEENSSFSWRDGSGFLITVESEPAKKILLNGYYKTLSSYFSNTSATDAIRGTTKLGFDTSYEIRPETKVTGHYISEHDDLNSMKNQVATVGAETKLDKTRISGSISNQKSTVNYTATPPVNNQLIGSNSNSPFALSQEIPHELTDAKIGVETELMKDLSMTAFHRHSLTSEEYHMSQAGLNYKLDNRNRLYVREEYQKVKGRDETRTLLGIESLVMKDTVAYNEYRMADGTDGARSHNILGLRNKFSISKNTTGNIAAEYLKLVSGPQKTNEPDAFSVSLGVEYLANEQTRVVNRVEHRQELGGSDKESNLGEIGLTYKMNPEYSLLALERYFIEKTGTGTHTTSRSMFGLAYRPLLHNSFNALAKMEYKHEANTSANPALRQDAWIASTEGVWKINPGLQLTCKYAGKLASEEGFSAYTDLIATRILFDITDRWDMGAEYRILNSHTVNSSSQGGALEIGYRVIKNLWVSAGYSFDRFDADLSGDSYHGEGPYMKLRVKFDENSLDNNKL